LIHDKKRDTTLKEILEQVPKVEFYDIDQHVRVLQEICRDFVGGER